MAAGEDEVLGPAHRGALGVGRLAPEEEHDAVALGVHGPHHRVRERLPALAPRGARSAWRAERYGA